jgi:hypothetical protein
MEQLHHFSEDPNIAVFTPHIAKTSNIRDQALVWAIDDWHAPTYYVPRDCPRASFWAGRGTTEADRERWLCGLQPRFVMVVEAAWMDRIRAARLYRYAMPPAAFTSLGDEDAGHYISREPVVPLGVEPMGDLVGAILGAGVELRVVERIGPMWRRIHQESTMRFSGSRLRNAQGYPADFGV